MWIDAAARRDGGRSSGKRFLGSEDGPMAAQGDHESGWFICRPSTINPSTINRFLERPWPGDRAWRVGRGPERNRRPPHPPPPK